MVMHEMHKDAGETREDPVLLTTKDVQRLIRVDRTTIYRMAEDGRLPAVKVGRQWRFPADRLYDRLDRGRPPGEPPAAGRRELIAPEPLQALAGLLGDLLGVMVLVTDMAGRPLAEVANPCGLFAAAHRHPGVMERCISGWRAMAAELDMGPQWQSTPLGFLCARTLVRVGDQLRGMVLAGGIAPADWPPEPGRIAELAAGSGVPAELLAAHADEVYRLSPEEQERVLRLLPRVGALFSRLAAEDGQSIAAAPEAPPSVHTKQRSEG